MACGKTHTHTKHKKVSIFFTVSFLYHKMRFIRWKMSVFSPQKFKVIWNKCGDLKISVEI